jgi:hypothetical protein
MALKSMSIEKLVVLKGQVEAALSSKVLEQRRALESHLSKLGRFQVGKSTSKAARGARAAAPKYRNPELPGAATSKANGGKKAKSATAKAKPAKAETCPICDFQTTPPHDGRTHRYQKKKAPLSAAELKDKGLTKV